MYICFYIWLLNDRFFVIKNVSLIAYLYSVCSTDILSQNDIPTVLNSDVNINNITNETSVEYDNGINQGTDHSNGH